jgi:hypothetical protein
MRPTRTCDAASREARPKPGERRPETGGAMIVQAGGGPSDTDPARSWNRNGRDPHCRPRTSWQAMAARLRVVDGGEGVAGDGGGRDHVEGVDAGRHRGGGHGDADGLIGLLEPVR